jgi:hypothetical protein
MMMIPPLGKSKDIHGNNKGAFHIYTGKFLGVLLGVQK